MKNEKIINDLELTIYSKGGSSWFCDYYFYNGINYERGATKASGYGYNKHSTATSNAINLYKFLYNFKNGLKWDGSEHLETKQGKRIYGLYKNKTISYGIGISSVLNCINAFSNVKIKTIHYGKFEDFIHLQITTPKEGLQKQFAKNQKLIDNKKTSKEDRKELIKENKKILELFGGLK